MEKREIGMRILITGANRGLGYEFVKQYLDRGNEVIAAARVPHHANELQVLGQKHDNLMALYQLDVTDSKSIQEMRENVETRFESLDLLINNAAIISGGSKRTYHLGEFHSENWRKSLQRYCRVVRAPRLSISRP
jgi:NAD(P)-dependent dehydrogenase (short-subunit alcohol dehydrogenase family)